MIQVIDASVVVSALLDDGPVGRWCEERMLEGVLIAPDLLPVEVTNVIRRVEARGTVDRTQATAAVHDLLHLDVDLLPFPVLALRTWDLRHNLTAYDACYVAAAELVGGRLVTLDRRLAASPGAACPVRTPDVDDATPGAL